MRPWTRIEQATDGQPGLRAAAQTAPMAAVLVLFAALTGGSVWIAVSVCALLATLLGVAVQWQARRGRPIKRVYDLLALLALVAMLANIAIVLGG